MAITSHDVARLAGVSQPTVSRALRDSRGVSPATRRKVREAARALGYVPIHSGRALSTQSAGRIGIVSAELSNPFYPALIEPLHEHLEAAGYRTILVTDRGDEPVEIEPLVDGSLDGVIITTSLRSSHLPGELTRRGVPCVLVNRTTDHADVDRCLPDNNKGAELVADLLLNLGHGRIAVIAGPVDTSTSNERVSAFRTLLGDRRQPIAQGMVHEGQYSAEAGREALLSLWDFRPTAVFCANDVLAFGAINGAHSLGLRVPQDLTVIGWDDIPMASWDAYALTTVRSDLGSMARQAVELMLRRIADPTASTVSVIVPPTLIRRQTHAQPRPS